MIITKLKPVHGGVFPGAAYNEKKVLEGVAELAGYANIDGNFLHTLRTLHSVGIDCSGEVERYLQDRSQTCGNTRSTQWQIHLALSCEGHEKNKEQLVGIAHAMMREYGAGRLPYLIYFHHDTENNHVHILTTRVTAKGRLLPDHNDYHRLYDALNSVISEDQKNDLERMLGYSFTTEGQLMNIARWFNYTVGTSKSDDDVLSFYHGGAEAVRVRRSDVQERIADCKSDRREALRREEAARRAKAIIIKYRELSLKQNPPQSDRKQVTGKDKPARAKTRKELVKQKQMRNHPDIKSLTDSSGRSLSTTEQYQMQWLVETLRGKLGIAVHFQKDKNGVVRGYGIVDHNNKVALNGSDVMKLADVVNFEEWKAAQETKAAAKARRTERASRTERSWQTPSTQQTDKPNQWNKPSQSDKPSQTVNPVQTEKPITIYQADSRLDIYRPLFKAKVGLQNNNAIVRMEIDGNIYDRQITDDQLNMYFDAPKEAQEDVAIRLAVFYFHREIYKFYRQQLAQRYITEGSKTLDIPESKVRCYKQWSGAWKLALDYGDASLRYDLTDAESRLMNRIADNDSEFRATKVRLIKEYITRDEANAMLRNIKYELAAPSASKGSAMPDVIAAFVSQHQQLMMRLVSLLSCNVGSGVNREFEVGGRRRRWDDIDDERRFRSDMSW